MHSSGKASARPSAGAFRSVRTVVSVGIVLVDSKSSRILNNLMFTGRVCTTLVLVKIFHTSLPLRAHPVASFLQKNRDSLVVFRNPSPVKWRNSQLSWVVAYWTLRVHRICLGRSLSEKPSSPEQFATSPSNPAVSDKSFSNRFGTFRPCNKSLELAK